MSSEPTRPRLMGDDVSAKLTADLDRDDLSRLVREANDAGLSFQQMADRAAAAGAPISKPYFQKMATNQVVAAPSPDRLRGFAAGIGRPLRIVQEAAAVQYLQYEPRELSGYGTEVQVVIAHLAGMSEGEVRRWRALIEADERARREQSD